MTRITTPTVTPRRAPSHAPPDMTYSPGKQTAHALGWFSIALGLAEFLAPEAFGNAVGVRRPTLIRIFGLREIITGIGILSSDRPTMWMWGRVAGDALDLAVLGEAMVDDGDPRRAGIAAAAVAGVMAADAVTATQMTAAAKYEG